MLLLNSQIPHANILLQPVSVTLFDSAKPCHRLHLVTQAGHEVNFHLYEIWRTRKMRMNWSESASYRFSYQGEWKPCHAQIFMLQTMTIELFKIITESFNLLGSCTYFSLLQNLETFSSDLSLLKSGEPFISLPRSWLYSLSWVEYFLRRSMSKRRSIGSPFTFSPPSWANQNTEHNVVDRLWISM